MIWVLDLWGSNTSGVVHVVSDVISSLVWNRVGSVVSNNFFNDLNIRSVEIFNSWDPLAVNFVFEGSSGWSSGVLEVSEIISDGVSKILVSLSSSSEVIGNLLWVFELDVSWSLCGSWGEFSLGNLVVPGSGIHVLNLFRSLFPFSSFLFKLISGSSGVFEVCFKIFFDFPF